MCIRDRLLPASAVKQVTSGSATVTPNAVSVSYTHLDVYKRQVQTYEELRRGGLRVQDSWGDAALYDADVEDILGSIREVPDDVRTLLVVGHAPGVPMTAGEVADHTGLAPEESRRRLAQWPPAGVGVVVHGGSWSSFPDASSALVVLQEPPTDV